MYAMFLGRTNERMILQVESRESHNDRILAQQFERFRQGTSRKFSTTEIQKKLTRLSFSQKSQNSAGMQLADLVAYPIGRHVLDPHKENAAFTIIESKLHSRNGTYQGSGLKVFP